MPMIVNTAWLLEYLAPKCSHEDLLDAFPRLGLEIEQTHEHNTELNVLPNRPDFLGLIGIAREVAALLRLELRYPATYQAATAGRSLPVTVDIREPELCPRYMCGLVARREGRALACLAEGPIASGRNATDQQRRRHHQLRSLRVGPAAARL